jgi:hypothetical protein
LEAQELTEEEDGISTKHYDFCIIVFWRAYPICSQGTTSFSFNPVYFFLPTKELMDATDCNDPNQAVPQYSMAKR